MREIPDYVKIDVDGLEHMILLGAKEYLGNKKIKSLSIEINENFKDQYEKVIITMKKYGFKILSKNQNKELSNSENFKKVFNYIFIK